MLSLLRPPFAVGPSPLAAPAAASPEPPTSPPNLQTKDLAFLLLPTNFHPLPTTSLLPPFLSAPAPTSTSPAELLKALHFRAAAIAAATALTAVPPPHDNSAILELWYIRLVALCLSQAHVLAAQEIKAFQDLSSSFYLDPETGRSIIPWELRVLAVSLSNDPRRSVAHYYELASECRAVVLDGTIPVEERQLWRERLEDLGVRVANALVLLGDFAAAARHLKGLKGKGRDMLPLLYLRAGMIDEARKYTRGNEVLKALLLMADGEWERAAEAWRQLPGEMAKCNTAVCELYLGRLDEARKTLELLLDEGTVFSGMIFNLATVYELCGDTAKNLKLQLAEKVAKLGREFTNPSFKM